MKIKVTYNFNNGVEDFTILDSHIFGYCEQIGDGESTIVKYFDTPTSAKNYITRLVASIHPTGYDLTITRIVLSWYDILMSCLDSYEKTGIFNGTTLKGDGKFQGNFISIELLE